MAINLACYSNVKRDGKSRPNTVPLHSDITLVVDRSASMEIMGNAVTKGVKEFLETQKKTAPENSTITIVTFDENTEIMPGFDNCKLSEAPDIDESYLKPRGTTKLIDTAMNSLKNQEKRKKEWFQKLNKATKELNPLYTSVFALLTDGHDNESKEYTVNKMNQYLRNLQSNENFECYFLGANQDAIQTGQMYGFNADQSLTYSSGQDTALSAMRSLSTGISRSVSGGGPLPFTPLMRQVSCPVNTSIPKPNFNTPTQFPPMAPPKLTRMNAMPIMKPFSFEDEPGDIPVLQPFSSEDEISN